MTAEHTPEQLALAKRIADNLCPEVWPCHEIALEAALAAIVETTERIKAMLDRCKEPCPDCWDAIERGDHLKDPSHEQ